MTEFNSQILQLTFATVILLLGLAKAWLLLARVGHLTLVGIAFVMTAAAFGTGPWLAYSYSGGVLISYTSSAVVNAYTCILLFLAGLHVCEKWISPGGRVKGADALLVTLSHNAAQLKWFVPFGFYVLVWVLRFHLANNYGVLSSGTGTAENLAAIPYVITVLRQLGDIATISAVLWAAMRLWVVNPVYRNPALLILLPELGFSLLRGRRVLLMSLVIVAVGFFLKRRVRFIHLAASAAVGFFILLFVFPLFLRFRAVYLENYSREQAVEIAEQSLKEILAEQDKAVAKELQQVNMATRPNIASFNIDLAMASQEHPPMWGRALLESALWSLPSVLYPQKIYRSQPEELVLVHYGFIGFDTASNWPAYGYADFGVMGGLVVGMVVGLSIGLLERFAMRLAIHGQVACWAVAGGALWIALSVEETPTGLWSTARNLILLCVIAIPVAFKFRTLAGTMHVGAEPQQLNDASKTKRRGRAKRKQRTSQANVRPSQLEA